MEKASATADESRSAAGEMNGQAEMLEQLVAQFRLK
jgi:methyl-accepting chemotaxis protein